MSVPVVPRWEWRTFGATFGAAENRLDSLTPTHVDESDEIYVLSPKSNASVKVRDGVLDVKRLEAVDRDGLEQWRPVLKASFPVSAAELAPVLDAATARDAYTLEELLDEVGREPLLQAVDVHKRREHYLLGDCLAELTELRTPLGATRTVAIESTDPALVAATVRELGFGGLSNVNMPRGLKQLIGFSPRFAVIDVGTNSVKLHVAEAGDDGEWHRIVDRAEVTRLGEGLDEAGSLSPDAVARTVDAIVSMVEEARRNGAVEIAAVGTAGLRIAPNRSALVDAVEARSGVRVEVISGEEEARLAYLAAKAGAGAAEGLVVVFDTGGGSSQFTFGHGDNVDERFSLNVGAARLTEQFGLDRVVTDETLELALATIAAELSRLDGHPVPQMVVGMGGAVTNLAAVKHGLETYDPDVVQGTVLDRAEIDRQLELFRSRTAEQRRSIPGLQPNRAEVILAGACIVRTVLSKLGSDALTVSDRGLRHGVLAERFAAELGSAS
jgi:exopolyphosphatase / guanosine-5'-triphosphate,3'-diphosphate pyrophosphatase